MSECWSMQCRFCCILKLIVFLIISFTDGTSGDFLFSTLALNFPSGSNSSSVLCLSPFVLDDALLEIDESFKLMLSSSDQDVQPGPVETTNVVIVDDESKPHVN